MAGSHERRACCADGNAETLPNAKPHDALSFYVSGELTPLGSARVLSTRRATWQDDAPLIAKAQQLLDTTFKATTGLDAGALCKRVGCAPRVWRVAFASDLPAWTATQEARGIVANLEGWDASGAVVRDSHLHHGRFGVRWKSSGAAIVGNRISARYMELSPLEYYFEGPFVLANVTVANNTFVACGEEASTLPHTACANETHLPLGSWCAWVGYGGGCGGICKSAAVGATELDARACTDVRVVDNRI